MSSQSASNFSAKEGDRKFRRPWHPLITLLHAFIIFILIRALNDIPSGSNYLTHSRGFLLLEIAFTILATYIAVHLTSRWVLTVSLRKIPVWLEYGCPVLAVTVIVSIIILVSHNYEDVPVSAEVLIPPLFVTVSMEILVYTWIKSSVTAHQLHETQLKNERIISSRLHTEMKLLQMQFHPHFLFNMLNTIYFSIDDTNVEARRTVEHLSNLLRGQLYSTDGKVPLSKEISALESYIFLASKRFDEQERLDIQLPSSETYSQDGTDMQIFPHLLLPVVENVFKHSGQCGKIIISLRIGDGWLRLLTENPVTDDYIRSGDDRDHGIGLKNLAQRLALIYRDDDYVFDTEKENGTFRARLYLKL